MESGDRGRWPRLAETTKGGVSVLLEFGANVERTRCTWPVAVTGEVYLPREHLQQSPRVRIDLRRREKAIQKGNELTREVLHAAEESPGLHLSARRRRGSCLRQRGCHRA